MTDDHAEALKARAVWFLRTVENMTYREIKDLTELDYDEISHLVWLGGWIKEMDRFRVQNCGRECVE